MDRRSVLKSLFGGAAFVAGGAALLGASTTRAEAGTVQPTDLMDEMRRAAPAVATEADIAEAEAYDAQWGWGGNCYRRWDGVVVCRRPVRVVRRRRRRCWYDSWGRLVCAR